jgi:hypothetical protein
MSYLELKSKFKPQNLPHHLINPEVSKDDRDYLFNTSLNKSHNAKEFSMSESFVQGENTKQKYTKSNWKNPKINNQSIQKPSIDVRRVIENLEMSVENSFTVENSYIHLKDQHIKVGEIHSVQEDEDNQPSRIFTDNIKSELDNIAKKVTETNKNYNFINHNSKNSFTPVNFRHVYEINKKLKFPRDDPLWYIYHSISKSSFGPISSIQLEELYNLKNIDGQSEVRLIDIFKIKNKGPFAYFRLKEIENINFLKDNIEQTNLLRYLEELNRLKKDVEIKIFQQNVKKDQPIDFNKDIVEKYKNKNNCDFVNEIDYSKNTEKIIEINKEINSNRPNIQENKKTEKKMVIPINTCPSVIEEEFENEKKIKDGKDQGPAKKKGKKKGKPMDMDIKTGFFTLSNQEKNYEPIYICGENEKENNN